MDAKAWDERYAAADLVWSVEPNQFVAARVRRPGPGPGPRPRGRRGTQRDLAGPSRLVGDRGGLLGGGAGQGPRGWPATPTRRLGRCRRDDLAAVVVLRPGPPRLPPAGRRRAAGGGPARRTTPSPRAAPSCWSPTTRPTWPRAPAAPRTPGADDRRRRAGRPRRPRPRGHPRRAGGPRGRPADGTVRGASTPSSASVRRLGWRGDAHAAPRLRLRGRGWARSRRRQSSASARRRCRCTSHSCARSSTTCCSRAPRPAWRSPRAGCGWRAGRWRSSACRTAPSVRSARPVTAAGCCGWPRPTCSPSTPPPV